MNIKNTMNQIRGAKNRATGEMLERLINAACLYYQVKGQAIIEKTPEPMRIIKGLGEGRFIAHFEKKAQPDFKGVTRGGTTIVFEAKHSEDEKIEQSRVKPIQAEALDKYSSLGAICYILVSIKLEKFYFVPWEIWKNMKDIYRRKYMLEEDLAVYKVPYQNGAIKFLG